MGTESAIARGLNKTWLFIILLFGVAIALGAIVVSFDDVKGSFINSFGCIMGTTLVCHAAFRLSSLNVRADAKELADTILLQREVKNLTLEKSQLQLEKERLERMRIDISSISPILKLGLIDINLNLHDFQKKPLANVTKKEGIPFFKKEVNYQDEYIGAINKKLSARLGIDMKKVLLKADGTKILVGGIKSEFQGCLNETTDWLLRELRVMKTKEGNLDNYQIYLNDQRIQDCMIEQEKSFRDRISLGNEFQNLESVIHEMARQYIRVTLAPLQKEIVFVENLTDGLGLAEFVEEQNRKVEKRLRELEGSQIS